MTIALTREQAQTLNPLIGFSAKDTMALCAQAVRSLSDCQINEPALIAAVSASIACALEFEGGV